MMSKKEKKEYVDDGHTIFDMNVDADWANNHQDKQSSVYVTKEEKKILIKAAFKSYIPKFLLVLFSFALAILLIYFWLK